MNLPNTAQLRPAMFAKTREYGKGGKNYTGGSGAETKMEELVGRVRARVERAGLRRAGWRVWVTALAIYCGLALLLDPDPITTGEDDNITLLEWVTENEASLRKEYQQRAIEAHEVCKTYDIYMSQDEYIRRSDHQQEKLQYSDWFTLKRLNWNSLFYVPTDDFVYCKVPKCGSSTWVFNLLKLANAPQDQISSDIGLHRLLRDYYPKSATSKMKQAFKNSFKFLVVRHPFERIISAYRDKLEDYQRDLMFRDGYYYTMYGKNIVRVYRDDSDRSLANKTEPTWREFVRYLINSPSSKFDDHWRPIYALCSPCVMKFNVIAKMETFSEDSQYIIKQLGLEDSLQVEWIHRTSNTKTSDIASTYFSQLTANQVDQLYQKYRLDFELFGYDYEDYRKMAAE
ncbi:carbohydrate sulfotransferase 11-like [Homarus americanus]|uniref:carbohydrate sulfotransferase 11-like n=1 Tax=Homarus americanus TaxID=6706 RepID=UPI001C49379C|nr:carbohydrate sulfotransferase 11-like [Homarus americanus]XP_042219220.1 carbohydrate sulfotransferase 11-like [Homarus americanus]XP_042219221.1 carbohydrate sulfotransferase 11-like [Homarus americanus]XP_042219222.1 carbohydrate sulfotransferase 11-like [Homarus americanus]XP_042219223.1 carbohydrate sulfotransferase 11-like [Homarus americanus]